MSWLISSLAPRMSEQGAPLTWRLAVSLLRALDSPLVLTVWWLGDSSLWPGLWGLYLLLRLAKLPHVILIDFQPVPLEWEAFL